MASTIKKPFAAETDLCKAFIDAVGEDWTPYPETAGFDILLVRNADGFQIGIEAKLKLNAAALAQALEGNPFSFRNEGPDCRAVLVPDGAAVAGVAILASHLAVTVIRVRSGLNWHYNNRFTPTLPTIEMRFSPYGEDWHELCPLKRHSLPDYVPDVAAGASAPVQLTNWKVKAIKIAIINDVRGFVTRADFKALKIDARRWIDARWMVPCELGFKLSNPDWLKRQHPRVYEEIKAQRDDWMPVPPLFKEAKSA